MFVIARQDNENFDFFLEIVKMTSRYETNISKVIFFVNVQNCYGYNISHFNLNEKKKNLNGKYKPQIGWVTWEIALS